MKRLAILFILLLKLLYTNAQQTAIKNPIFYNTTNQIHEKMVFKSNNIFVIRNNARVLRYDGKKWDYFDCTNNIKTLDFEIADDGTLWIGGELGLYKTDTTFFNQAKDIFPIEIDGQRVFDSVYFIKQMKDGIWVASNKGLTIYRGNEVIPVNINNGIVYEMLEGQNGNVFIGSNKGC